MTPATPVEGQALDLGAVPFPQMPVSEALPLLSDVDAECHRLQLGMEASELHGGLSGWLAGGADDRRHWLAAVLADDSLAAVEEGGVLDQLWLATSEQLADEDFGFSLLLPDEDASLYERSESLFGWCRGFVGAFGLAAGGDPPLSEEGLEALADLVKLGAGTPQPGGDEEDEAAFAEIEEFVRVAALLLYGDCVAGPSRRRRLN